MLESLKPINLENGSDSRQNFGQLTNSGGLRAETGSQLNRRIVAVALDRPHDAAGRLHAAPSVEQASRAVAEDKTLAIAQPQTRRYLMNLLSKVLSKAQQYAKQNPDKVKKMTDKAARFVDQRTEGKYRDKINGAVRKVDGITGNGRTGPNRDEDGGAGNGPRA